MIMRGWDPFTVIARLDDDFDELVRRSFGTPGAARSTGFVPAVEMAADGPDVLITLELPGLDAEDVDLQVHDGRLTITGERRDSHEEVQGGDGRRKVLVRELRYGSFRREFALPDGVTADDVSAHYDKGLLHVRVANVTKPVEAPRKIQVTSGGASQQRVVNATKDDKAIKA
jgi:HSP20 family protein